MINYDDLEMALIFSTSGELSGECAYIDRNSGQVYFVSDAVDEEYPEDIEENDQYIQVPHKRELDLGKALAIAFVQEFLPEKTDVIYKVFSSRGAFSVFKEILFSEGLLDQWYEYENTATREALLKWCKEEGISVNLES